MQHQAARKARGRRHHHDGRQVTCAQERNAQKRNEEHQCRAEVAHQRETAHAVGGKEHGKDEVSLGEQTVERRRAREDEGDLHQLRRLQRERADRDPVLRAEDALAEQDVEREQRRGGGRHRPAQLLGQAETAQRRPQQEKQRDAERDGNELFEKRRRCVGRHDRDAEGDQEEHQRLQLVGRALHGAVEPVERPARRADGGKAQHDLRKIVLRADRQELHEGQHLEDRQQPQGACGGDGVTRPAAPLGLPQLLFVVCGEEVQLDAADGDGVPGLQARGGEDVLAV